jgi:hypothetical protein
MHGTSATFAARTQVPQRLKSKPHETISLSVIDGLIRTVRPDRKGRYHVPCPLCSSGRSTPHSRAAAVLCIWTKHDGFASFKCMHCGEAGYALDNNAPPPDPKKIEQQRAENERKSREDEKEQLRKALWLWSRREPIVGTIVETYLREARGINGPTPKTLFCLPPYKHYPPAMIAPIGLDTARGVHITRLKPDGSGKAYPKDDPLNRKNKIMIGRNTYGLPIALALPHGGNSLAVTEGIEDCLSVHEATGLGVWVAGCASRMPALADTMPSWVGCVTVCADADADGQRYARELARRLLRGGIEVFVDGLVS